MAVINARYDLDDASDLHLVPGMLSPHFDQLLRIVVPGDRPGDPDKDLRGDSTIPGVTVTYGTNLRSLAPVGHGIIVLAGGQVRMSPGTAAPTPGLRSFILTATIVEAGRVTFRVPMRVHVHERVEHLWLRPNPLTLRKGAAGVRLSVMAKFSDGTIGDVTNWGARQTPRAGDLTYATTDDATPVRWLKWSHTGDLAVDPDTGVLSTTDTTPTSGQGTVTVKAGPVDDPATTGTAVVAFAPPWNTPVTFKPVGRDKASGFTTMGQRTNVLILPDGFKAGEQAQFESLAASVVGMLRVEGQTRPFDLFHKQTNFFTAWVASRDAGVSVLDEVRHGGTRANEGRELQFPGPKPGSPVWGLGRLVGQVGLPTPDDRGVALGTTASGRLKDWRDRFGDQVNDTVVSAELYAQWLALADWVLVDEVDTAFHRAFGARPRRYKPGHPRSMKVNPRRLDAADFDAFLTALHPEGIPHDPDDPPFAHWFKGGQDAGNIVILCRSLRHGGANTPEAGNARSVAMALDATSRHRLRTAPPGVAVDAYPIPSQASPEAWTRMAHELAHSWDLGDEYAEDQKVTDPGKTADIIKSGNVQHRASLLTGVGVGILDSENIKWSWPRLASAGVLKEPPVAQAADGTPTQSGSAPEQYLLKLRHGDVASPDGSAFHFVQNDIVRLRTRPLATSTMSAQVKVTQTDPFNQTLIVRGFPGHPLPPNLATGFKTEPGRESTVIKPLRVRDPNFEAGDLGVEILMVSGDIQRIIHGSHNPLNAAFPSPEADREWAKEGIDEFKPTPARQFVDPVARPFGPRYSSWIVGLYEQGAATERDVYRPTGICLMRRRLIRRVDAEGEQIVAKDLAYQFCDVCRYVLVDRIDPALHPVIDADYEKRYFRL